MELDLELLNAFCDEALDLLMQWEGVCLSLKKEVRSDGLMELFRHAHNLKGGSRAVGLMELGDAIHKIEDGITLLRDGKVEINGLIISKLLLAQKLLWDWVTALKADPNSRVEHADFLQSYSAAFTAKDEMPPQAPVTEAKASPSSPPASSTVTPHARRSKNETLRIPSLKLDDLLQVIGEISIQQSIIWHARGEIPASQKLFHNAVQLSQKLTKELYERALSLRMQPLQNLFQRLERNILDLSQSLGKSVTVEMSGSDVELDKAVIEKIMDPLTHIVRNAIDHGIERTEDRLLAGKSEAGHITLSAKQDAFGIELTVRDDGKGLHVDKILTKALEKSLIAPDSHLSRQEIFKLIFLPGFSTADKVTDVSGRGVGMDVVKRSLEDLRGSITIDSEPGRGTAFVITLPTSVSILDALLVKLDDEKFVIPVDSILEVVTLSPEQAANTKTMMTYNGHTLPVYDVSRVLGKSRPEGVQRRAILVCRERGHNIGLAFDEVLGQQQIVNRPLNGKIDGSFGLLGGTILGNGEPGLIVDIAAIVKYFFDRFITKEPSAA